MLAGAASRRARSNAGYFRDADSPVFSQLQLCTRTPTYHSLGGCGGKSIVSRFSLYLSSHLSHFPVSILFFVYLLICSVCVIFTKYITICLFIVGGHYHITHNQLLSRFLLRFCKDNCDGDDKEICFCLEISNEHRITRSAFIQHAPHVNRAEMDLFSLRREVWMSFWDFRTTTERTCWSCFVDTPT